MVVELCESEDCSPCGVTLESPWNEFEAVTCRGGGRMANEVHLTHPSAYLILCEVEVYGGGKKILSIIFLKNLGDMKINRKVHFCRFPCL